MAFNKVQHISVTLDFMLALQRDGGLSHIEVNFPGEKFDILRNPVHLRQALRVVGFDAWEIDDKGEWVVDEAGNKKPAKIDKLLNVNVRCNNKPYLSRKCVVFAGRMVKGFKYAGIYDGVDILDVAVVPENAPTDLVSDFEYDVPVVDKVNTRKYTKREDRNAELDVEYTQEQLEQLSRIFGE